MWQHYEKMQLQNAYWMLAVCCKPSFTSKVFEHTELEMLFELTSAAGGYEAPNCPYKSRGWIPPSHSVHSNEGMHGGGLTDGTCSTDSYAITDMAFCMEWRWEEGDQSYQRGETPTHIPTTAISTASVASPLQFLQENPSLMSTALRRPGCKYPAMH